MLQNDTFDHDKVKMQAELNEKSISPIPTFLKCLLPITLLLFLTLPCQGQNTSSLDSELSNSIIGTFHEVQFDDGLRMDMTITFHADRTAQRTVRITNVSGEVAMNLQLVMRSTWQIENGYLKEMLLSAQASGQPEEFVQKFQKMVFDDIPKEMSLKVLRCDQEGVLYSEADGDHFAERIR